jgi:hypothetical protein
MNTFDYVVIGVTMKSKGTPKSKDHATLFHTPTPRTWPVVPCSKRTLSNGIVDSLIGTP